MTALLAGWASERMPTQPDEDLLGYDFRQDRLAHGNAGELDPLHARAVVLAQGSVRCCLVTLDHCVVSVAFARELRSVAAAAAGCHADQVVVACTHTHSAPMHLDPELAHDLAAALPNAEPGARPQHARVRARLVEAVRQAATRAGGLLVPVEASAAQAPCGLAYRRRCGDAAPALCWNPQEQHDLAPGPGADPALTTLLLRRRALGRSLLLWNLGAHPVCLGKTSTAVSADWPGAAARALARLLPDCDSQFVLGPCGDTHPWIATQDDPAALEILGSAAGGCAAALAHAGRAGSGELRCLARTVRIGTAALDLSAWRIGPAVLLAAPVELFQACAADLRRRVAAPLLFATIANGWTGYWTTDADLAAGGYEADAARARGRVPGDADRLVEALASLAAEVLAA